MRRWHLKPHGRKRSPGEGGAHTAAGTEPQGAQIFNGQCEDEEPRRKAESG